MFAKHPRMPATTTVSAIAAADAPQVDWSNAGTTHFSHAVIQHVTSARQQPPGPVQHAVPLSLLQAAPATTIHHNIIPKQGTVRGYPVAQKGFTASRNPAQKITQGRGR
eukprot:TRINITY_DN1484_c0_g1_i1.p3 TRINITY_DN1484_c0_g1~~TRINITY_DN1484_c0_g1_i1.p3  ORF type:complete len:109 (-),score=22.12 TRINITY_DN1484_c0_g1_i1:65-391(-)